MKSVLHYGNGEAIRLELAEGSLVADCAMPRGEPVDAAAATRKALIEPVDFPPLATAIVPGDQVTIALGHGVPQAAHIVQPIVELICEQGVSPQSITILRTAEDARSAGEAPTDRLSPECRSGVRVVVHHPDVRSELSYLANTTEGHPVYLNRALCDADMVLPIGRASWKRAGAGFTAWETLYPTFSDTATQDRFVKLNVSTSNRAARTNARQEVREVDWLLGVLAAVQVVPAGGGGVLQVYVGQPDEVRRLARRHGEQAWNFSVPHRASLVVAAIEGDSSEQTWESVGRALAAASRAVAENGAIAVCTKLEAPPGPGIQHLGEVEDLQRALREIRRSPPADALPATQMAKAMDRARVYLLSGLDDEVVETLGMAPVADADEIPRLAARHESCILLGNAQHAAAIPLDDE